MIFSVKPTISKEYLLQKQTQETYLTYYLGIPVKKGLFRSPLRDDKRPTCSFYKNQKGDIIFKDFNGSFSGNFIDIVRHIHHCTYLEALNIIATDFGYIDGTIPEIPPAPLFVPSEVSKIQIQKKEFTNNELQWWAQYGITKDILKQYNVYSCQTVFLNDNIFTFSSNISPVYGYYRGIKDGLELWRIYMPLRTEFRFISNWKSNMLQGSQQLPQSGKYVVITKSMKDVMTLATFNIPAIAPNSEHVFLSQEQYDLLKRRFKTIYILYDTDLTGIRNMNKIRKQFKIKCLWIPRKYNAKDISDFYKLYGRDKTLELINKVKLNE